MKKIIAILAVLVMVLTMTMANAETAGMANPWVETDAEQFCQVTGVELNVPEDAENVHLYVLESENLGEMQFEIDGQEYCARVCHANEFTDISGMHYEWTYEDDGKVSYVPSKLYMAKDGENTVEVCLWYDVVPGIMYSLSTVQKDVDGLDLEAIAAGVFKPMQGDA